MSQRSKAIPAAVAKRLDVRLPPADAFRLFTEQMNRWWPMATHSVLGGDAADFVFGTAVGEAVCEVDRDGQRHPWGTITEWQPPHRFAMSWHPGRAAAEATRLRVEFSALDGGGTRVELRHDGWEALGDGAAGMRDRYDGGWDGVLAAFAARARAERQPAR